MIDPSETEHDRFTHLMALHKYFLNADFMRDVFLRRIKDRQSLADVDYATSVDDSISMSLWYATVYVVIEGWRKAKLADPEVYFLLANGKAEDLRRFRNQVFHYQPAYENLKLLELLGRDDVDAQVTTVWIERTHAALGRGIERAVEVLLADRGSTDQF